MHAGLGLKDEAINSCLLIVKTSNTPASYKAKVLMNKHAGNT